MYLFCISCKQIVATIKVPTLVDFQSTEIDHKQILNLYMMRLQLFGAVHHSLVWAALRSTVLTHIIIHMILLSLRELSMFQKNKPANILSSFLKINPRIILRKPGISNISRLNSFSHDSVNNSSAVYC